MATRVKTRRQDSHISFPSPYRKGPFDTDWVKMGPDPTSRDFGGRQITVSEGHRKNPSTGHYDSGGPFYSARVVPDIPSQTVSVNIDGFDGRRYKYNGPIICPRPLGGLDLSGGTIASQDSSHLDKYGADAIHAVDPTNPNAQLGVALGEILVDKRISLPGIESWRRRTQVAKAAGGEYLSAVFGWLPLVSDVKNTSQSIRDHNHIMNNYVSNAGKRTRREFEFEPIIQESENFVANARAYYGGTSVGEMNGPLVPVTRSVRTTTRRWFSGAFTYANADASSIGKCLGVESEIDKLFGLTLTPDVLWELTPWSWAIDWFSNAGSVISNATSMGLAGLVMSYGYIMEEKTIIETYSMPASGIISSGGPPPSSTVTSTVKYRREANPFGFGISWEGLSPAQLAITAALGITRLR